MYKEIHQLLELAELPAGHIGPLASLLHTLAALLICWLVYFILRKLISPLITRLVIFTKMKWDEKLFSPAILKAVCVVVFWLLIRA